MEPTLDGIGILTQPLGKAGVTPLSNITKIVSSIYQRVCVITGDEGYRYLQNDNNIEVANIESRPVCGELRRIVVNCFQQARMALLIVTRFRDIRIWIFFIGGESAMLPMLVSKVFRKRVVLVLAGFPSKIVRIHDDPLSGFLEIASRINLSLSNSIVAYSKNVAKERNLGKHSRKIEFLGEHIVDVSCFKPERKLADRERIVGYVGNLSVIKGIPNLMKAMSIVHEEDDGVKFIIAGEGELEKYILELISDLKLSSYVSFSGWIPHDRLAEHFNRLRLVVLPSLTEGLPNVMLEAMGCGTPVLACSVSAIPDIIRDRENGFLLKSDSPECIAKNIKIALDYPQIDLVAAEARTYVVERFELKKVVERWKHLLKRMDQ